MHHQKINSNSKKKTKKGKSSTFDLPSKSEFSKNVRIDQKNVDFITKALSSGTFIGKHHTFFDKQRLVIKSKEREAKKLREAERQQKLLTLVEDYSSDESKDEIPKKRKKKNVGSGDESSSDDDENNPKKSKHS